MEKVYNSIKLLKHTSTLFQIKDRRLAMTCHTSYLWALILYNSILQGKFGQCMKGVQIIYGRIF